MSWSLLTVSKHSTDKEKAVSCHHWEVSHFTWKSKQLQITARILLSTKVKGNTTPTKLGENTLILQQIKQEDSKPQGEVNAEQTWDLTPA